MIGIYINCKHHPYVSWILNKAKIFETRNRDTLGRFLGEEVLLVESGYGKPLVRGSAIITTKIEVFTREEWEKYMHDACIIPGSEHDWKPNTKKKVLYMLERVREFEHYYPAEGIRHGRTWIDIENKEAQRDESDH